MPTPLSSYNNALPSDVILDSGVLMIGNSVFAATMGGLDFDGGTERRNIDFDGKRSDVEGLDRTTGFKGKITGSVLQLSPTTFPQIEAGATNVTPAGAPTGFTTGYSPKVAGVLYGSGDYLTNIRAVWERGDGTFVQVRFPVALVTKWKSDKITDKNEAKFAIEIEHRLNLATTGAHAGDAPWVMEYFATNPLS